MRDAAVHGFPIVSRPLESFRMRPIGSTLGGATTLCPVTKCGYLSEPGS
jgi:hypothetical protein